MTKPWIGAARRAKNADFREVAETLGCDVAAIEAVWQVETAGKPFRTDGSLERRFEPHKTTPAMMPYSTSKILRQHERERLFSKRYAEDPDDAMRATSWGGPQIMGFNSRAAGYPNTGAMVEAMADSEREQLRAFVRLLKTWGLDSALRAHDWRAFTARYNGNANVADYSSRIETAYQALSGKASPLVLRSGDKGAAVRRLQEALDIDVDGSFGPMTDRAVREFQRGTGLPVDGVVGQRTWAAIERRVNGAAPLKQEAAADRIAKIGEVAGIAATAAGAVATVGSALPESTMNLLIVIATVIGVAALALHLFRKSRGVA